MQTIKIFFSIPYEKKTVECYALPIYKCYANGLRMGKMFFSMQLSYKYALTVHYQYRDHTCFFHALTFAGSEDVV